MTPRTYARLALLAAVIWSAPALAQTGPLPEPLDATFNIFMRATLIGLERVRVEQTATGWTISCKTMLSSAVSNSRWLILLRT